MYHKINSKLGPKSRGNAGKNNELDGFIQYLEDNEKNPLLSLFLPFNICSALPSSLLQRQHIIHLRIEQQLLGEKEKPWERKGVAWGREQPEERWRLDREEENIELQLLYVT